VGGLRAAELAERYGGALIAIAKVLADDTLTDAVKVRRARLLLVALDSQRIAAERYNR
jgi:hypothetical protein